MRDEYTDPGVLPRRPEPKTRSGRRRKRIREHGPVVPTGPSPAARALVRVVEWQKVIEAEGIDRAEIARRNGYTRARVTQLMSLLRLPDDLKTKLPIQVAPECRGDSAVPLAPIFLGLGSFSWQRSCRFFPAEAGGSRM
jgi:hypothetical protein